MQTVTSQSQFRLWFLVLPVLFTVDTIIIGIKFQNYGQGYYSPVWPAVLVEVLFWTEVILGALFVYLGKGRRLGIVLATLLLLFLAYFFATIAEMSIYNRFP